MDGMRRLLRILGRCLFLFVALVALVYVCEDSLLRFRLAHGGRARVFDTLTVYEAGAVKGNKLEYYFDQPQAVTCVRAMFPHLGVPPCWYVRRHSIKILSRLGGPAAPRPPSFLPGPAHAARSSQLEVIWIPARSDRYTGHCIANTPCTRSMVSRFSSSAAITNDT